MRCFHKIFLKYAILASFIGISTITRIYAQEYWVKGYVYSEKGEPLCNATVIDKKNSKGVWTNNHGYFVLKCSDAHVEIRASYVGYTSSSINILSAKDTLVNFFLREMILDEIVVRESKPSMHNQFFLGKNILDPKSLGLVNSFIGQTDIVKSLASLPGVSSGREGFSNIYVRGGDRDQNLYLIDGIPVYNQTHLYGFLSIFNPAIIKKVDFYRGGFPARFGGKASSVIDIVTYSPSNDTATYDLNVGLLSAGASLSVPIIKSKSHLSIAVRSAYFDLITLPIKILSKSSGSSSLVSFNFYDFNLKLKHYFNPRSTLNIIGWLGKDRISNKDSFGSYESNYSENKRNGFLGIRHDWVSNSSLALQNKVYYSGFKNYSKEESIIRNEPYVENIGFNTQNMFFDLSFQSQLKYYIANNSQLGFGLELHNYRSTPNSQHLTTTTTQSTSYIDTLLVDNKESSLNQITFFTFHNLQIFEKLSLYLGLRYNRYYYNDFHYNNLEPRLSASYLPTEHLSFKLGYAQVSQPVFSIKNNPQGIGSEQWVFSNETVPPISSEQYSLGFQKSFSESTLSFGAEIYYKRQENLFFSKHSPAIYDNILSWSDLIIRNGLGSSAGLELNLAYSTDKIETNINYTVSKSLQKFRQLNNGKPFAFNYDRTHQLDIIASVNISKSWEVITNFVFATGAPFTYPTSYIPTTDYLVGYYHWENLNNNRMPPYHRLDISFKKSFSKKGHDKRVVSFNIYNIYSRRNASMVYLRNGVAYQKSLFPVIPSISYKIHF